VGGQRHPPATFTPGKDPVPIVQEAGWAPGPVWVGAENLSPTGVRSADLSARSESVYRLSYPRCHVGLEYYRRGLYGLHVLNDTVVPAFIQGRSERNDIGRTLLTSL
jgi:hypothetical protein